MEATEVAATADAMEHVETVRIRNQHAVDVPFYLEPWGEEFTLSPSAAIDVVVEGPTEGSLEVELAEDRIVVYAWPGSTVSLFQEGQELGAGNAPRARVPPLP